MEGLLAILVGAFAVAVSPLVPVMRPAAKAAVKGGLALAGVATGAAAGAAAVATGAAAAANHQWEQLRTHATAEKTTANGAEHGRDNGGHGDGRCASSRAWPPRPLPRPTRIVD